MSNPLYLIVKPLLYILSVSVQLFLLENFLVYVPDHWISIRMKWSKIQRCNRLYIMMPIRTENANFATILLNFISSVQNVAVNSGKHDRFGSSLLCWLPFMVIFA